MSEPVPINGNTHITVGDIINSMGVAIGPDARSYVRIYRGPNYPRPDYRSTIEDLVTHHTKAFVGREQNVRELMNFAAAQQPGYLLLEVAERALKNVARIADHTPNPIQLSHIA